MKSLEKPSCRADHPAMSDAVFFNGDAEPARPRATSLGGEVAPQFFREGG